MNFQLQHPPKTIKAEFILCPICGNKTRVQIREDMELKKLSAILPQVP